jgi:hypothetical protein
MAERSELSVITKAYDLALWLVQKVDSFPRARKFTLGDRVENTALELLAVLLRAKYTRSPASGLREANLLLQQIRFLLRMAKDLQCLSIKSYEFASRQIEAIGVEVGGWLKQQKGKDETA